MCQNQFCETLYNMSILAVDKIIVLTEVVESVIYYSLSVIKSFNKIDDKGYFDMTV